MVKVMALLRTLVLISLVAWMTWALPWGLIFFASAVEAQKAVTMIDPAKVVADINKVAAVGWGAIGWIALETLFGWTKSWFIGRKQQKELERTARAAVAAATAATATAAKKAP